MKSFPRTRNAGPWGAAFVLLAACGGDFESRAIQWQEGVESSEESEEIQVPPPPFTEGAFPCTDCHDPDIPVNRERREMEMAHDEIVFDHDSQNRWCLDCHSSEDRDQLHLASGKLVPFEESYKLCGQCHGDKYRDWRAGVHGRRTGRWDGEKEYLLCVHCHDAHSPAFKPIPLLPGPTPPRRTR